MMTGSSLPTVTVVIPVWNEAADITRCLEMVAKQDYPGELLDVVVIDGGSTDGTPDIVTQQAARLGLRIQVLHNPRRRTSISLQVGLAAATGEILARIDARSRVSPGYIARCLDVLHEDPSIGVVGGAQVPTPRSERLVDRAIARSLRNRYSTGLSRYRRASTSGPSDTVWMGVFRTAELRQLGGWSEEVALNEDWELNARYRAAGRTVWFLADERSGYLPRTSYRRLARQYFQFGRVKGLWWLRGMPPGRRQVAMLAAPALATAVVAGSVRRFGAPAMALPVLALVGVDAAGCREPAGAAERAASAAAIGVYTTAWWIGTVVGAAGELLGIEHQHRSPMS